MKANGIYPNGGPSTTPSMTPPPAAKPRSKAEIAKAATTKKRKIEGTPAFRLKEDEEEDDAVKPKLESFARQSEQLALKAEPVASASMPFLEAHFALSSNQTAAMEHASHQQHFGSTSSIFEEFCVPEMFAQHDFEEEPNIKTEQQQPRHIPPPPPAMAEQLKQSSRGEERRESGKGPLESIVIAD